VNLVGKTLKEEGIEASSLEEDMEEGVHYSHTQKIPISLINQQEKISGSSVRIWF
jgi:hypothetical protein